MLQYCFLACIYARLLDEPFNAKACQGHHGKVKYEGQETAPIDTTSCRKCLSEDGGAQPNGRTFTGIQNAESRRGNGRPGFGQSNTTKNYLALQRQICFFRLNPTARNAVVP